jgi:hypothetical protein
MIFTRLLDRTHYLTYAVAGMYYSLLNEFEYEYGFVYYWSQLHHMPQLDHRVVHKTLTGAVRG